MSFADWPYRNSRGDKLPVERMGGAIFELSAQTEPQYSCYENRENFPQVINV